MYLFINSVLEFNLWHSGKTETAQWKIDFTALFFYSYLITDNWMVSVCTFHKLLNEIFLSVNYIDSFLESVEGAIDVCLFTNETTVE